MPVLLSLHPSARKEALKEWQSHGMEGGHVPAFLHGRTVTPNYHMNEK